MKHAVYKTIALWILLSGTAAVAQNPVSVIDGLDVEIWPDYDRASVLVLLTGTLPAETRLPAVVALPLSQAAKINAVARIDAKDGIMKDDITSSRDAPGKLSFTTPDLRFRVEYYIPYTINDDRRAFGFDWSADTTVNRFQIRIQQPASAGAMDTIPAAGNIFTGKDGFVYHTFSPRIVRAKEPFSLQVEYRMNTSQLSVARAPSNNTSAQTSAVPVTSGNGFGISWPLAAAVAGGVIIIAALFWQIVLRRAVSANANTGDPHLDKGSHTKFCYHCGEPVGEGDNFCSDCGSEL